MINEDKLWTLLDQLQHWTGYVDYNDNSNYNDLCGAITAVMADLDTDDAREAEKLAEALELYADKRNWRRAYDGQGHLNVYQADTDGPYTARDALDGYRGRTKQEETE